MDKNSAEYKTQQLILYICDQMKDESTFGATVLNKILYYVDNVNYVHHGKPISNFTYIKQDHGVTPNPTQLLSIKAEFISANIIEEKEVEFFGYKQKKIFPKVSPDVECFSGTEVSMIDKIITAFKKTNATEISHFSHNLLAWQIAAPMEEIPLYAYLLTEDNLTHEDLKWAENSIREYESMRDN